MEKFVEFEGVKYEIPPATTQKRIILFLRHLADYKFISEYVNNLEVLDVGCGYGYGSFLLSLKAKKILGADLAELQIEQAKKTYKKDNLDFLVLDATQLEKNFPPESFDVVIGMQLIEHLELPEKFIESAKKVLKKNGLLIVTTPNKLVRMVEGQKPWNSDHIREYDPSSLEKFLGGYFKNVEFYSLLGSEKVYELEKKLRGGNISPKLKVLWRYTPEFIRQGVRKGIDSKLEEDEVKLDDYEIVKGAQDKGLGFFAFCRKN
ncbi:MAG: class I SAM-dependent methyltransferase [bacterium]|nr:class I SAM-dependent methyltransferase [bacterium]